MKVLRRISRNSRSYKILKELYEQGKIKRLSAEESYELDRKITEGMREVNDDYQRKSLATIASLRAKGLWR